MFEYARGFSRSLAIAFATFAVSAPAEPHSHVSPDGSAVNWYPHECCNNGDCRPVASIKPAPHGLWMTTVDGHTVLVGPRDRRRPPRDARWHICIGADDIDNTTPRITCIFEPPVPGHSS